MGKHIKQTQKEVWKHQRFIVDDLFNSDNTYDWNAGLKILLPCIEAAYKSYMDKNQKVMNNRAKYKDMLTWALNGDKRINKKIASKLAHGLRGGIQHKNVLEGGITVTNGMRDGDSLLSCISKGKDGKVTLILWSFWAWVLFNIDRFYELSGNDVQVKRAVGTFDPKQMTMQQLYDAISIKTGVPSGLLLNPTQDVIKFMQEFKKMAINEALSDTSDIMDSYESESDNQ